MMTRRRPARVQALRGIGVDTMGAIADQQTQNASPGTSSSSLLRMENLDTDIPPPTVAASITAQSATSDQENSYLPFIGQLGLRNAAATHVSAMAGNVVSYTGEKNCVISAGGLSGILNTLLATVEMGDGVVLTDPTYSGLINRVKLAGGIPVLVPFDFVPGGAWMFDREKFRAVVETSEAKITAMLLMSPALPSGAVLDQGDWEVVAEVCVEHDILLILDAAMERLLFDGRRVDHPASMPGMAQRTITIGSASKELRMIGWRVGWIVGPEQLIADIALVGMANVVVPVGIAQKAAQAALERSGEDISSFVDELQARRDVCMEELAGLPVGVPAGGWSFVLRVDGLGWTGSKAAEELLRHGVCVTPMDGWGIEHGSQYVRFVFSNEPCERLKGLGAKVRAALVKSEHIV